MYLPRTIDGYLQSWASSPDRKPLVVKGPRQIGKTESILHFAREHYSNIVEINFMLEPQYRAITEQGYSVDSIVKAITLIDPSKRFVPGKTLIFFDELQEHPDIATAFKAFKLDGKIDIIASGSMLGMNYKQIEAISVGYKTDYEMYSLDFGEFLNARGYDSSYPNQMLSHMIEGKPFTNLEHEVFTNLFLDYCALGGMPDVVRQLVEHGTFEGTLETQRQIVQDYREDIQKYAEGLDKARILNVFDSVPAQLAKENKKFQATKVAGTGNFKEYRGCLDWLATAGMVRLCRCLSFPELPLKGNTNNDKVKAYYADTGLLIAQLDEESQQDFRANKNLGIYKGGLYESIVSEALVKSGYELYYYKRENSTLEQDFMLRTANHLVPIEVKAKDGRAKSMRTLIDDKRYADISWGTKLHSGNIGVKDDVHTFPYYCAFLLKDFLKEQD